jgi:amino-acid N-acetyltransferase
MNNDSIKIQNATAAQVPEIHALINFYAELDKMLFRSKADIYENLQLFITAEQNTNNTRDSANKTDDNNPHGRVVGCCALQVMDSDLAEIKSLAVKENARGKGIGRKLVQAGLQKAADLKVSQVFVLTLEPEFFKKLGFKPVDRQSLPMKVWKDCARCPKQDHCDESALIIHI